MFETKKIQKCAANNNVLGGMQREAKKYVHIQTDIEKSCEMPYLSRQGRINILDSI